MRRNIMKWFGVVLLAGIIVLICEFDTFAGDDESIILHEPLIELSQNGGYYVATWDNIYFGNYWQNDTNGDGKINTLDEKQPIRWRVLDIEDDSIFLLSEYCLEEMRFNSNGDIDASWDVSTVRSWLNCYDSTNNICGTDYSKNGFLKSAFSSRERSQIVTSTVQNNGNERYNVQGKDNTYDQLFYLSLEEIYDPRYGLVLNCTDNNGTTYRKSNSAALMTGFGWRHWSSHSGDRRGWSLRDPGSSYRKVININDLGELVDRGASVYNTMGVRPAMRIPIDDDLYKYAGRVTVKQGYLFYYCDYLELDCIGGNIEESAPLFIKNDSPYGELPTPYLKGHSFVGWYSKADGGDKIENDTIVGENSPRKLYAHWLPEEYEVTFDAGDGTVDVAKKTVKYADSYGELPIANRKGYKFEGWFDSKQGGMLISAETVVDTTTNHILYAHWTPLSYIVSFNSCVNGLKIDDGTVTYGESYGQLPVPETRGFTFAGWYDEEGKIKYTENTKVTIADNHTLYASWEPIEYSIRKNEVHSSITLSGGDKCVYKGRVEFSVKPAMGYYVKNVGVKTVKGDSIDVGRDYTGKYHFYAEDQEVVITAEGELINEEDFGALLDNCHYSLKGTDDSVKLVVSGMGSMGDVPWSDYTKYITDVEIKDGVTDIPEEAFKGAVLLRSITIPDSVKVVNDSAFEGCESLMNVTLPSGINMIGEDAFLGCFRLRNRGSVTYGGSREKWEAIDWYVGNSNLYYAASVKLNDETQSHTSYITMNDEGEYVTSDGEKLILYTDAEHEGHDVFGADRDNLEYFIYKTDGDTILFVRGYGAISEDITAEPVYIFGSGEYKNVVTKVIIEPGVTDLCTEVFRDFKALKSIEFEGEVPEIPYKAFSGCTALENISIPDSVTKIGEYAFEKCSSLKKIYIPDSVTEMGESGFDACTKLEKVKLSSGITKISGFMFKDCSELKKIFIPESVVEIGDSSFAFCTSLRERGEVYFGGDRNNWISIKWGEMTGPCSQAANIYYNSRGFGDDEDDNKDSSTSSSAKGEDPASDDKDSSTSSSSNGGDSTTDRKDSSTSSSENVEESSVDDKGSSASSSVKDGSSSSEKKVGVEDRVPVSNNTDVYGSSNDNFAPVATSGKINQLSLDFSQVDSSTVDPLDLKMTMIKGSKCVAMGIKDVSVTRKVKARIKNGIATVIPKGNGSATFETDDGKKYMVTFNVEIPKPVKAAKTINISEGSTKVLTLNDMFGTTIDGGELSIVKETVNGQAVVDVVNKTLVVTPKEKDSIQVMYQFLNKKYKLKIKVK